MAVNLIIESPDWEAVQLAAEPIIGAVLTHQNIDEEREVALVLSDDETIRRYNREFRGKDKATNVLSFPSDEPEEWGDILMAYETVAREAGSRIRICAHATHLLVHGMLHLLGYDHEKEQEAEEMESLEIAILGKLGIENPYR